MTTPAASARGICQALRRHACARRRRFRSRFRRNPCAGRRERRRQIDPDPYSRRRPPRRQRRDLDRRQRSVLPVRTTPSSRASSPSRRNCGWCRPFDCGKYRARAPADARAVRHSSRHRPPRMREEAKHYLDQLNFQPDLDRPVDALSFAERQLVAIAKALRLKCRHASFWTSRPRRSRTARSSGCSP